MIHSPNDYEPGWKKYLSSRDVEVCVLICSSIVPLGFNEIKRTTGFHQEILSRILKRLIFMGNVSKNGTRYERCCNSGQ